MPLEPCPDNEAGLEGGALSRKPAIMFKGQFLSYSTGQPMPCEASANTAHQSLAFTSDGLDGQDSHFQGSQQVAQPPLDPSDISVTPGRPTSRSKLPPGLSASWHASSAEKEQGQQQQRRGLKTMPSSASWNAVGQAGEHPSTRNSRESQCGDSSSSRGVSSQQEPGHDPSMSGLSTSTWTGRLSLGGATDPCLMHKAFVGWPRAVVVHSELRSEVGFAGTVHEASEAHARTQGGGQPTSFSMRHQARGFLIILIRLTCSTLHM